MKFKKALFGLASVAAVATPVAAVVSCGTSAATAALIEKSTPVKAKNVWFVADGGSLTDKSFNQNSLEGVTQWTTSHSADGFTSNKYQPEDGKIKDGYRAAKKDGAEVVIGSGYKHADQADWFTADQSTTFIGIDQDLHEKNNAKLASVWYESEKAGYLAGIYAVQYIQDHSTEFTANGGKYQVATFGGEIFDTVTSWMDGFVSGAKAADTALVGSTNYKPVEVVYTGSAPSKTDFTLDMFATPSQNAASLTKQLIGKGADIIFPAAGPQIQDAMKAAQGQKVKFIGVDGDQRIALQDTNNVIIGSALKNLNDETQKALTAFYDTTDTDHTKFNAEYVAKAHIGGVGFVYGSNSEHLDGNASVPNVDPKIQALIDGFNRYSWQKVFASIK